MNSKDTEHHKLTARISELEAQLNQREKELVCILELSDLIDANEDIDDILAELVFILKRNWRFPEVTEVKITHKDSQYQTGHFAKTQWTMQSDIIVQGKAEGKILVTYRENKTKKTNPFLQEEYNLLHIVSGRIGTEIERLEKAYRYSELFHTTNQAIVKINEHGIISETNQAAAKLTGHSSSEELIGKAATAFYANPADREQLINKTKEEGGELYNSEVLLKRKDGSIIPTLINIKLTYDNKGKFSGTLTTFRDISEQKKVEQALTESEEKFRSIFENSALGIFRSTPEGKYEIVNQAFARFLGFESPEKMLKEVTDISELYKYPKDRDKIKKEFAEKGIVEDYEIVANHPRINTVWISINAKQHKKKDGSVYYEGTVQDITEKKLAREELKESRELFRKILDNSMDAILLTGPDGSVYSANSAACRMFGRTEEDICEVGRAGLVDLSDPRLANFLETRKKQGKAKTELKLLRKDGTTFPTEISSALFKDKDGKVRSSMIVRDITDWKQAEANLKAAKEKVEASKEKYRLLFDNSLASIIIFDTDYKVVMINEAAASILQSKKSDIIGKSIYDFFPDTAETHVGRFNTIINEGKPLYFEDALKLPHGTFWLSSYLHPVHNKKGEVEGIQILSIDITEKKIAEEKRRKSDERFRIAQEMSPDGFTILHPVRDKQNQVIDFEWVYENKAIAKLNGTDPLKIVGKRLLKEDPDHKNSKFFKAYKYVAESGKSTTFEEGYSGGTRRNSLWLRIVVVPMAENIAVLAQNITERKMAEENLKHTFNLSPSIIAKANLNTGFYIEANQAVTRILGYSVKEFTSIPISQLIHPDDVGKTSDKVSEQLKGQQVQVFENRFICKDGAYKWISWNATTANEQGIVLGVGSDITDRKQAELKLKAKNEEIVKAKNKAEENEAILQDAQRIANIGNWRIDLRTGKVEISDEMLRLIGLDDKNVAMDLSNHEKFYTPESWIRFQKEIENTLTTGKSYEIELEFSDKNPNYLHAIARGEAVYDKHNNIVAIKGTLQDITHRKETELELQANKEEYESLNEELRQTNHELFLAKEKAEESDRLKSAFLANMSHEIRTPMNGILGFTSLLQKTNLSSSQQKHINIIQISGKRLLNTVNDIIDISKIESGAVEISASQVNINEQLAYIHAFFKPEATKKGIQFLLKNELSGKNSTIKTDPEKLNSILTNLIKNAIKFTDQGIIVLGCKDKREQDFNELEFYVEDSGIGIPENRQAAIFDRFVQADVEDKDAVQGSGLGLAISKAYVEMLDGNIWLDSEIGKGSTFHFTIKDLSLSETISIGQDGEQALKKFTPTEKLKILLVEDDETSLNYISIITEPISNETIVVSSGMAAVEACKNTPDINLILMDIQMSGMNGYEATRQIRQFNKEAIIIAQTAFALAGDKEKAIKAGCNDYISKPINETELLNLINKYFGK